jgi:hypothetical protein
MKKKRKQFRQEMVNCTHTHTNIPNRLVDFNTFDDVTDGLMFTHEELTVLRSTPDPGCLTPPTIEETRGDSGNGNNATATSKPPVEKYSDLQCEFRMVEREGLVMPSPLTNYRVPVDMLDIAKFAGDVNNATGTPQAMSEVDAVTAEGATSTGDMFEKMQDLMAKCKRGEI